MKLEVKYSELIQGDYSPKKLNLMLVFQVNCPGCFLYAIPQVNFLNQKYGDKISFYGMSTAFEDFEWNTSEHTRLLVEKGLTIGETKKALARNNRATYNVQIDFPVMFDAITSQQELMQDDSLERLTRQFTLLNNTPADEVPHIKESVRNYLLHFPKVGYTFINNWLGGTPTYILFNDHLEILGRWFGETPTTNLERAIVHQLSDIF